MTKEGVLGLCMHNSVEDVQRVLHIHMCKDEKGNVLGAHVKGNVGGDLGQCLGSQQHPAVPDQGGSPDGSGIGIMPSDEGMAQQIGQIGTAESCCGPKHLPRSALCPCLG